MINSRVQELQDQAYWLLVKSWGGKAKGKMPMAIKNAQANADEEIANLEAERDREEEIANLEAERLRDEEMSRGGQE